MHYVYSGQRDKQTSCSLTDALLVVNKSNNECDAIFNN